MDLEVIEWRDAHYGPHDEKSLDAKHNYAVTLDNLERFAEA